MNESHGAASPPGAELGACVSLHLPLARNHHFDTLIVASMDSPQVRVPGPENHDSPNPTPTPNPDSHPANNSTEVEMGGTQDITDQSQNQNQTEPVPQDTSLPDAQSEREPPAPKKKSEGFQFLDFQPSSHHHTCLVIMESLLTPPSFLTAPVVEIVVGQGENETVLTAHQPLLLESPFLSEFVDRFEASGPRRIHLPDDNVEAFGCFLQFQYTRDYTVNPPETPTGSREPEGDTDQSGEKLLQHARIYTLAEKLGLPTLKSLAHTKIHRVNGTPSGELAYARYVYTHTPANDITIRRPVASYWASRGHILRQELDEEFKKLCIEVPEFTFDVLTISMDRKEKSSHAEADSSVKGSARKRLRSEK
ncbi:uncharacterized protein N7459_002125 [Penicillium hispanicum]|uniref:uncharacterized protein n=1 Tax=Penicillium hispanicum TaxID=1080232 RepID=UPI00253FC396|nr:uncharacterized protein N7459_002125 [Penicillium hispanicum]KAJ5591756.1 hypothetical protein N7459_002125 [Penicillium hispanicum]